MIKYTKIVEPIKSKLYDIKMYIKVKKLMKDEENLINYLKNLEAKIILCNNNVETVICSVAEILQISILVYSINPVMANNENIHDILQSIKPYMDSIDISKFL